MPHFIYGNRFKTFTFQLKLQSYVVHVLKGIIFKSEIHNVTKKQLTVLQSIVEQSVHKTIN